MEKRNLVCGALALLMAVMVWVSPATVYGETKDALTAPVVKTTLTLEAAKPKLSWEKVEGADKYQVFVATAKDGKYVRKWTTVKNTYIHEEAKAGQKYYYKVRAIAGEKKVQESPFSKIVIRTCGQPYIVSITDTKYTYVNFKNDVLQLVKKYPDILEKQYLGKTVDERNLYALTLGNPDA
ncbi:MAG: hypothetical protein IKU44_02450, partial [Firmicutes bacterium]|nr:hypothetical protein [Bacillota bacterium]